MSINQHRVHAGVPAGGQFAATLRPEAGIVLTPGETAPARFVTARDLYLRELETMAGEGTQLERHFPATRSEAKRLLKNLAGEKDGHIRYIDLDYTNAPEGKPGEHVEVVGPKDGRPVVVNVFGGFSRLKVTSGKAIIRADSHSGNPVTVGAGAEAVIISNPESKVTVDVEEGGKATFVSTSAKNRFNAHGAGTIETAYGTGPERRPYIRPTF